jgi:uncharacterized protein YydD (DUF2326 family)
VLSGELSLLSATRSKTLAYLGNTDIFTKYRELTEQLAEKRAEAVALKERQETARRIAELKGEAQKLQRSLDTCFELLDLNIAAQQEKNSRFFAIRSHFVDVVKKVINRSALLNVYANKEHHLDFSAEFLDEKGIETSAKDGHSYIKLLCIAFDMALLRAYHGSNFPRFVFHDGAFETLDERVKKNLLDVMREYSQYGIQQIVTVISSDIPVPPKSDEPFFEPEEIILTLHDDGAPGRLFKMAEF